MKYRKFKTDQDIIDEARRYKTKGEWSKKSQRSHQLARQRGIFDACIEHMPERANKIGFSEVLLHARNYESLQEWRRSGCIYYKIYVRHNLPIVDRGW